MESKKNKLPKAVKHLEAAIKLYKTNKSELYFLTLAKTFETVVEYVWRELKRLVEDQGLEAPAPKMAIKEAARLKFISEPEIWLDCIDARNNSVHDYFGISEPEYCELAEDILRLIKKSTLADLL